MVELDAGIQETIRMGDRCERQDRERMSGRCRVVRSRFNSRHWLIEMTQPISEGGRSCRCPDRFRGC
jgi:hypothetical protein